MDDCIILSKYKADAGEIFNGLNTKGFKMADEGTMEEYLGILFTFTHYDDKSFKISQPHLIKMIIESVPRMKDTGRAKTPAQSSEILNKDKDGELRK